MNSQEESIPQKLNNIANEVKTLQISEIIYKSKLKKAYDLFQEILSKILYSDELPNKDELLVLTNEGLERTYDYRDHINDIEHADTSSHAVVIFIRNLFPFGATRPDDANLLKAMISLSLRANRKILVSAKGVSLHNKIFWIIAVGYLYGEVPSDRIESLLTIDGINQTVAIWLKEIMNQAKNQVNSDDIQDEIRDSLIDIPQV